MPTFRRQRSRLLTVACVAIGAVATTTTSASAGVLTESAADCAAQPLSQPFTPWLDYANYTPAPDGTLEAGAAGWALDGAGVVAGNEPWRIAGAGDRRSLRLDAGGSATTPTMCVGIGHPTIRFFARRATTGLLATLSSLRVDVLYENHLGLVEKLPIGNVTALDTGWSVTSPFLVVANLLPLLPSDQTPVRFRFTAQGAAAWQVDDVFVDPYRTN